MANKQWNVGWTSGVIYAAGWLQASHGDARMAVEMLEHAGFATRESVEKSGAADYDIALALDAWDCENGLGKYSLEIIA